MTRTVKRAYKFRCYPDAEQAALLSRTFGCVRVVYNKALAARSAAWKDEGRRISYVESSSLLTGWKKDPDLAWLSEVSSVPLQQALRHLQTAFMNFWAGRAKYPTFKSKKTHRDSAEFTYRAFNYQAPADTWTPKRHAAINQQAGQPVLTLAKTTTALKVAWHRRVPAGTPSTVTVSRDPAGRWFVSLLFETEAPTAPEPVFEVTGVDMGQTDTVVTSSTTKAGQVVVRKEPGLMPRKTLETRLRRAQRTYARTVKGSKNRAKAARKIAKIHAAIADARRDHLHNLSTTLVRESQAIGIEDLDVRAMTVTAKGTVDNPGVDVKKKAASNRNNLDVGYRALRTMIEYKADWAGRQVVAVDRYYPSTRLCSTPGCDYIAGKLPTTIRSWSCPKCKTRHDRDINAATNIRTAATAEIACGSGIRLHGGHTTKDPGAPKRSRKLDGGDSASHAL